MNNRCKLLIVFVLIFMVATMQLQAEKYKGPIVKKSPKESANCFAPANRDYLELNNVRAYLKTNGTMWFSERAAYEVPKGSGKTSLFSSSLWIGGYSLPGGNGSLYMAAMRFAQVGNDYWTGPLHMVEAKIDPATCSQYDKFFRISRTEVEKHIAAYNEGDQNYSPPKSITEWPAHGRAEYGESRYLAPFYSPNGNETYNPFDGDYPYYDLKNELCPWTEANREKAKICPWINANGDCDNLSNTQNPAGLDLPRERIETKQAVNFGWDNKMIYADHVLKGDETVFWFLNDKGGPHTETRCPNSIGLEIRVQAFAFSTNDELNKMTFYSYEIINRGSITLYNTYFSQWCDPDLGYAYDDFVGCDVIRGLGYCYNGKEIDGSGEIWAYGENPPAVGLDFFQGPYIDPDGSDNPKFDKEYADINGNEGQKEYCRRYVEYIFKNFDISDPNLLDKIYVITTFVGDSIINDTIRWNNQFAINGVNFGDGIVDNERFGMRAFTYHNNEPGPRGDPSYDYQYYNYLTGKWNDGVRFTYGGTGYSVEEDAIPCDFVFPKGTDYCNWGTKGIAPTDPYNAGGRDGNWCEMQPLGSNTTSPNEPHDRRFMQSAGPFTLRQGACNYITVGVPWARTTQGGVQASIDLLMIADDKCQALFENCFKLLDGPDAPNLTIREYNQKLILLLTNSPLSNNANEDYEETDLNIPSKFPGLDTVDRNYRFEGYQIFQVVNPSVGASDLDNPDLARLVCQVDLVNFNKDGLPIGRLINWEFNERLQLDLASEKVAGSNNGIQHSFEITQDVFASGNRQLVNYKTYYFIAIAYAYNEYAPYTTNPDVLNGLLGQKLPYLRGRKTAEGRSVIPVAGVPHPPTLHGGGATLNCDYWSIPYITRIDGQGNGGIAIDLKKETIDKIMSGGDKGDNWSVRELEYEKNAGPLNVRVIDPLRVRPFDYTLVIVDDTIENDSIPNDVKNRVDITDNAYWIFTIDNSVSDEDIKATGLVDNNDQAIREFVSQRKIGYSYEQIIMPLGISVNILNTDFVNKDPRVNKYLPKIISQYKEDMYRVKFAFYQSEKIDMTNDIVFENNQTPWITGLVDDNRRLPSNWIRSGNANLGPWTNNGKDQVKGDFNKERLEDFFLPSSLIIEPNSNSSEERAYKDISGKFGTVCKGTWAPYVLTSPYDNGPMAKYTAPEPVFVPEGLTEPIFGSTAKEGLYNYHDYKRYIQHFSQPGFSQTMTNLYSVNVVLTPDKSKWTRCIVLEACQDREKSEGGALKHEPRKAKSVGKDGKPDGSKDGFTIDGKPGGEYGMGWFPGYAINVETGERLNMMFAENSDYTLNDEFGDLVNGRDMLFNPTSTYAIAKYDVQGFGALLPAGPISKEQYDFLFDYFIATSGQSALYELGIERVLGGMHYVYVCNSAGNTSPAHYLYRNGSGINIPENFLPGRRNFNVRDTVFTINYGTTPNPINISWGGYLDAENKYSVYDCGPYDESKWLVQKFAKVLSFSDAGTDGGFNIISRKHNKMQLFNNVMYAHIPMQPSDPDIKKQWLTCDVTYKIRVTRPYMRYISRWYESPELRDLDYTVPPEYEKYKGLPIYKISTKGLSPTFHDTRLYQSILDNINIVPNPYYGASLYETNALETMVKITNLPTDLKNNAPVTINIFTVNGILVRTLTKGDSETSYVNWDLKNYANIPIASGVYIIHVNCPGIGERMLKFFCTMRQTDLNTF